MADLSTLGVKFGYAVETTPGVKPTAFNWLQRCRSIGGISLSNETIDASCLEDLVTKYIKGRADTGGEWEVVFLSGGVADVKTMMAAAATGATSDKATWFEVYIPNFTDAFYVIAQPGVKIPLPEIGDNSALEFTISLTVVDYKELDTAIEPTAPSTES